MKATFSENDLTLKANVTVGIKGDKGDDGITPHIGENGNWYIGDTDTGVKAQGEKGEKGDTGAKGDKGEQGQNGADGYTPIKGTDYWTEADKAEIVADVLAEIPVVGSEEY